MRKTNAKQEILDAATCIFSEKGYDAGSVDDIAKMAGVPKSLIYYHFKNKKDILSMLTDQFVQTYQTLVSEANPKQESDHAASLASRMKTTYYSFGEQHTNLVRILFMNALKRNVETPDLLRLAEVLVPYEVNESPQTQKRRIAEFFTSLLPAFAYLCFADDWVARYGLNRTDFDQMFLSVYNTSHGAIHTQEVADTISNNDHPVKEASYSK